MARVPSSRLLSLALALVLGNVLLESAGCSASSSSRVQETCDPGSRRDCTCNDNQIGTSTCDDAGVYASCSCGPGFGGASGAMGAGATAGLGGSSASGGSQSDASSGSGGSVASGGSGGGALGSSGAGGSGGAGGSAGGAGVGGGSGAAGTSGAGGSGTDAGDGGSRSCVTQLVAGSYDTCALKNDRSVWCWGGGNPVPARIAALTEVMELSSGTFHKCARKIDGSVWCWGTNSAGQLGDSTLDSRTAPIQVRLGDGRATFLQTSAGGFSSCARLQGGSVWCWGANSAGQVGNGATSSSVPSPAQVTAVDSTQVAEIIAEGGHTCTRMTNNTLRCWGGNVNGELGDGTSDPGPKLTSVEVAALGPAVVRSSGRCAIKNDLTLWCWGLNASGQVGDGTTTHRLSPVQVTSLSNTVAEVTRTFVRTCARKLDGSVWCWGRNGDGSLGDGTVDGQPCPDGQCKPTPVRVAGIGDAAAIASGIAHGCAAKHDGATWCWGANGQGQLGDGTRDGEPCSGGPCRPRPVQSLLSCP